MPVNERLKKAKALITEARMLLTSIYIPEPITREALALVVINGIPLFNNLLKRLNNSSSAISTLIKKTRDTPFPILDVAKASPFVGVGLTILDFIQIPLLYLTALALGEKPPVTLTNNARWFYATVILGLALVALFIPVTAPFIAIVSASLGVLACAVTLGKIMHEYYEDKNALKRVMEKINNGPVGQIQKHALELENACKDPDKNSLIIDELIIKIEQLKQDYVSNKADIIILHKNAYLLKEKMQIEADVVDNCIGIGLSSLAVSGTVVSLFFPPAGLIILLTTALTGTVYVVARLAAPDFFTPSTKRSVLAERKESPPPAPLPKEVIAGSTGMVLNKFKLEKIKSSKSRFEKKNTATVIEQTTGPDEQLQIGEKESGQNFKR